MPRKMVKNYRIVSLSLGIDTINKIEEVNEKYGKWKWNTQMKKGSQTEVCELAIRIGLPVIKQMLEENKMSLDLSIAPELCLEELGNPTKTKPATIGDLTDSDLEKLDKESEGES